MSPDFPWCLLKSHHSSKSPVLIPYLKLFIFSFTELILHCTSMMIDTILLFHQKTNCRMEENKDSLAAILGLALLGALFPFQSIETYPTRQDLARHPKISSPGFTCDLLGMIEHSSQQLGLMSQLFRCC